MSQYADSAHPSYQKIKKTIDRYCQSYFTNAELLDINNMIQWISQRYLSIQWLWTVPLVKMTRKETLGSRKPWILSDVC
jgi:hypothetical protein